MRLLDIITDWVETEEDILQAYLMKYVGWKDYPEAMRRYTEHPELLIGAMCAASAEWTQVGDYWLYYDPREGYYMAYCTDPRGQCSYEECFINTDDMEEYLFFVRSYIPDTDEILSIDRHENESHIDYVLRLLTEIDKRVAAVE